MPTALARLAVGTPGAAPTTSSAAAAGSSSEGGGSCAPALVRRRLSAPADTATRQIPTGATDYALPGGPVKSRRERGNLGSSSSRKRFNAMNTFRRFGAALLLLFPVLLTAAEKPRIDVQELALSNGMRFLLFERHESPTLAAGWLAHVGSVNEREGITGISHLFEHMMFKGTKTIGTKDIQADLRIIDEQEQVPDEMRREMEVLRDKLRRGEIDELLKPENWTPRYRELQKRFEDLVAQQRQIII